MKMLNTDSEKKKKKKKSNTYINKYIFLKD